MTTPRVLVLTLLAFLTLSAASCAILPQSTPDPRLARERDIATHQAQWQALAISSYTVSITRGCFCPPDSSGPFRITVKNGVVASVTYEGRPVPADRVASFPLTIDAVFALLRAQGPDAEMTLAWDPDRGFPTSASVDPIPDAVDDEFSITVADFAPAD